MTPSRKLICSTLVLPLVAAFAPSAQLQRPSLVVLHGTFDDAKATWGVDDSYTTTESGLLFKDTSEGDGESPVNEGTVFVHYKIVFDEFDDDKNSGGTLYFDSRVGNTAQEPLQLQYGVTQIVKGWEEGMASMKVGGSRTLVIPADLGYGDKGLPKAGKFPAIPPGANLRFELELVDVDNSQLTMFRRKIPKPSSIFDRPWF